MVKPDGVTFTDAAGTPHPRTPQRVLWDPVMAERAGFKHFMLKEIFEQPRAVGETLSDARHPIAGSSRSTSSGSTRTPSARWTGCLSWRAAPAGMPGWSASS